MYRMLKAPLVAELRIHVRESAPCSKKSILKPDLVESSTEKVCRDVLIPYIMFDSVILPNMTFHVEIGRPILLEKAEDSGEIKSTHLLLHFKFSTPLTSQKIRYTLLKFVRNINP